MSWVVWTASDRQTHRPQVGNRKFCESMAYSKLFFHFGEKIIFILKSTSSNAFTFIYWLILHHLQFVNIRLYEVSVVICMSEIITKSICAFIQFSGLQFLSSCGSSVINSQHVLLLTSDWFIMPFQYYAYLVLRRNDIVLITTLINVV